MKQFIKVLMHGWLIDYHLRMAKNLMSRETARDYHHDLSTYYFKKCYGKEWDEDEPI